MIKIETILNHLSNHKDINAYDVRDTLNSSSQLYFVKEKLETNRFVDTETLTITLYVDHKEYRGSSSFVVTSADDETSLEYKIDFEFIIFHLQRNIFHIHIHILHHQLQSDFL